MSSTGDDLEPEEVELTPEQKVELRRARRSILLIGGAAILGIVLMLAVVVVAIVVRLSDS